MSFHYDAFKVQMFTREIQQWMPQEKAPKIQSTSAKSILLNFQAFKIYLQVSSQPQFMDKITELATEGQCLWL